MDQTILAILKLNNISTETYLQETLPLPLFQTMSCELDNIFLTGNVNREKLHECGGFVAWPLLLTRDELETT